MSHQLLHFTPNVHINDPFAFLTLRSHVDPFVKPGHERSTSSTNMSGHYLARCSTSSVQPFSALSRLTNEFPACITTTTPASDPFSTSPLQHQNFAPGFLVFRLVCVKFTSSPCPAAGRPVDVIDTLPIAAAGEITQCLKRCVWHDGAFCSTCGIALELRPGAICVGLRALSRFSWKG